MMTPWNALGADEEKAVRRRSAFDQLVVGER